MSALQPSQLPPSESLKHNGHQDDQPRELTSFELAMTTQMTMMDNQPSDLPGTQRESLAWQNSKKINAVWSIDQNRNVWAGVIDVGWKKLANNSDTAIVALNLLACHARITDSVVNYRENDSNGMIEEMYVW
jgi:hypothetical protein